MSAANSHTPGPWRMQELWGDQWTVEGPDFEKRPYMGEADARLIAAAPEMLEALRDLVDGSLDLDVARALLARLDGGK